MSVITPEQRDLFTAFEMVMSAGCDCRCRLEELNGKAYLVWQDDYDNTMVVDIATSEELDEGSKEYKYLIYEEEMDEEDEE